MVAMPTPYCCSVSPFSRLATPSTEVGTSERLPSSARGFHGREACPAGSPPKRSGRDKIAAVVPLMLRYRMFHQSLLLCVTGTYDCTYDKINQNLLLDTDLGITVVDDQSALVALERRERSVRVPRKAEKVCQVWRD